MSETEYASQRNCRFDDCLYADDGFIAELPVSYRTENLGNSYYCTENHGICHFSHTRKIAELADFQRGICLYQTRIFGGLKAESEKGHIFDLVTKHTKGHCRISFVASCYNTLPFRNWCEIARDWLREMSTQKYSLGAL